MTAEESAPKAVRALRRILDTPPQLLAYKALGRARRRWRAATVPARPIQLTDAQLRARLRVPYEDEDALLAHFRARPSPFHLQPTARAACVQALDAGWPGERPRLVAAADAIVAARRPDWHLDPDSGHRWPLSHFSTVDYLDLGRRSDVKRVWNLSRQHELVTLGQARWLTGCERYAEVALDRLDSWLDANPVELGVNWTVAMEAAQRLASWTWALHFLLDAPALTPARLRRWLGSIWHHARFVEENLEFTTRAGNHLIADAVGLVYAGVAYPEFRDAERWRERGLSLLGRELLAQVYPDGVDYEASSSYHRMVLEFGLDAALLGRRAGRRVAPAVQERLAAMAAFSRALTGPDGLGPMVGDADDGFLWRLADRQTDDHRPAIALAAVGLSAPRLDEPPPPELLWLLGPDGPDRYRAAAVEPVRGDRVFPLGGFYLTRGQGEAALLDCGHLGMGPGGHGGHGHLDCLSLVAWDAGGPILVDPGTYVYTGDPEARRAFRRTAAHNTVAVDGLDQAEMTGLWSLDNRLWPTLELWHGGDRFALVDASHSGYARLASPVTHRRQLVHVRGRYWLVVDLLVGTDRHLVERHFHFPPGARAELAADHLRLTRPSGALVVLAWPPSPLPTTRSAGGAREGQGKSAAQMGRGSAEARRQETSLCPTGAQRGDGVGFESAGLRSRLEDAWVSRAYGQREPAPVLVQRLEAALPLALPIVIAAGAADLRVVPDGPSRWRIEHPGGVDDLELAPPALTLRLADGATLVADPPNGAREDGAR
jgi:hypothetical protein